MKKNVQNQKKSHKRKLTQQPSATEDIVLKFKTQGHQQPAQWHQELYLTKKSMLIRRDQVEFQDANYSQTNSVYMPQEDIQDKFFQPIYNPSKKEKTQKSSTKTKNWDFIRNKSLSNIYSVVSPTQQVKFEKEKKDFMKKSQCSTIILTSTQSSSKQSVPSQKIKQNQKLKSTNFEYQIKIQQLQKRIKILELEKKQKQDALKKYKQMEKQSTGHLLQQKMDLIEQIQKLKKIHEQQLRIVKSKEQKQFIKSDSYEHYLLVLEQNKLMKQEKKYEMERKQQMHLKKEESKKDSHNTKNVKATSKLMMMMKKP